MNHRERVLAAFDFAPVDHVPYDLMEAVVWKELQEYFAGRYGLSTPEQVHDRLDVDCRWVWLSYQGPTLPPPQEGLPEGWRSTYSDALYRRPLAEAHTVAAVEAYPFPDPAWWQPTDYAAARARWPEHALVLCTGWMPLFCSACNVFGMEEALVKMVWEPAVFEAFVQRQHAFYMDVLRRALAAAQGHCDICWLGDDYATQKSLLMHPALWRKFIKPALAEQVRLVREHGLRVLFHSCGAVRPILPDLIEIGVNAMLVFQTSAAGMDAPSIARAFGGKMTFYGGLDIQQLLTHGTPEQVRAEVCANVAAFAPYGGYIVANSHHCLADIRGENIEAMCRAARECSA